MLLPGKHDHCPFARNHETDPAGGLSSGMRGVAYETVRNTKDRSRQGNVSRLGEAGETR